MRGMRVVNGKALRYHLAVLALVLVTVLVGALRPLVRGAGHSHGRWGLGRLVLLSEPAVNDDAPPALPVRTNVHLLAPLLAVALLVLKMRRSGFAPIPVRRLKLPTRHTSPFLPSH